MKRLKTLLFTLFMTLSCFQATCFADDNDPQPNQVQQNKYLELTKKGPRSGAIRVLMHYYDGQMWFDLPGNIDCLNVSVWNLPTGEFIEEQVCDSTPFDVPYTEGTLIITCSNDEGLYGEGTIELNYTL